MLTVFSEKLVNLLIRESEKSFDKGDIEVYVYGVECFLNMAIVASILCLWGILTHNFFETLLWIISFSLIRHYAGGLHAPSELSCIISSILIGATNYFAIQYAKLSICFFSMFAYLFTLCSNRYKQVRINTTAKKYI